MENISNLIVTVVAIIGAITAAVLGGLAIWTFRDIRSRSRDILAQVLATVMVAVVPVAGILVYFMLRPRETLAEAYVRALEEESLLASIENQEFCPACGRRVDPDMVYCPSCHTKLRNPCPNCHRAVHLSWDMCPYCGETLQPEMPMVGRARRRNISSAPARPATPLPATPPKPINTLPAAPSESSAPSNSPMASFTNVLDRIGGAVEGLVDHLSSHDDGAASVANPSSAEDPAQTEPTIQRTAHAYPHQSPNSNGHGEGIAPSSSGIKPLISRDEPQQ